MDGPILRLAPRVALAFALALHELATNSAKYGALSNDSGRVLVSWDVVSGSQPGRLCFQWQEVDGPAVSKPTRTGFGTRMIERALAQEISGTAEIVYRPRGVVFTAEALLAEISRSSPITLLESQADAQLATRLPLRPGNGFALTHIELRAHLDKSKYKHEIP